MVKTGINQKKAAKEFAAKWLGRGDEKQDTQAFWTSLLRDVFGVVNPEDSIQFEKRIKLGHTSFIDAYIPSTKVLIEQKSIDVDLLKPAKQSDGNLLTPYRQAKRYADEMPNSLRPNWIVVCNFREFLIYDMEKPHDEPVQLLLEDLPDKFESLRFMIDSKKTSITPEEQVSLKAGELVGKLYDAILKQYKNPESAETLKSLNILCVRLVFLLYAEDAGIFPEKDMFGRYLAKFRPEEVREKILNLFAVLNTKPENRDPYLSDDLAAFPYVNGGLFADLEIEIPRFNEEIVDILVNKASSGFDWSEISPTIFGAVFESTLNPETRRKGGMHYTSIENIHKVIDPLFMNDLKAEFAALCKKAGKEKIKKLDDFRNKLASLTFLDPACGSGNFLTETYISLRRLENECLKVIHGDQMLLSSKDFTPIKVKISQFYGIEINDFAVTVAKTALWIAESQMMKETEEIVERDLDFLPLSTSATIVEGNALRIDWRYLHEEPEIPTIRAKKTNLIYPMMVKEKDVEYGEINLLTDEIGIGKAQRKQDANHYDYIMGNPPFVGKSYQSPEQKNDMTAVFKGVKNYGNLDFVASWYKKACDFIQKTRTKCAFVSTNSICQGIAVPPLWKYLFAQGIQIDFAWRTFRWDSESTQKAHVHCVIVGFSYHSEPNGESPNITKRIFSSDGKIIKAGNINAYLLDAPNIIVEDRHDPVSCVPKMAVGSFPTDGGNLIISEEEYDNFLNKEPDAKPYVKKYIGPEEFINDKNRWCLWLKGCPPSELIKMPIVLKRIEKVRAFRLASRKKQTQNRANTPALFAEDRQPNSNYIMIPRTSGERNYLPMGFFSNQTIAGDTIILPDATLYHFGILESSVHMAWMRAVCGRLEMRYRYSNTIVYNNFPWCNPTKSQKAKIEHTAQQILDARTKYPKVTPAKLYGTHMYLFPELVKAHEANDLAVMQAYGFNPKMTEAEIVAELFKMYEKLTKK